MDKRPRYRERDYTYTICNGKKHSETAKGQKSKLGGKAGNATLQLYPTNIST
ncbi:hypothetical protein GCM10023143_25510 [Compostibacter hankyongensis]|uniref:Uncharacterized protein n=1 Tax=Compostibacter hankyongensis TaxID=1007089 RepID=A0ABP8G0J9_9BACT